jgi:hypothetical protein
MDAIGRFVADAVLGIDTLWGGDVMCPSGTGRFIADSWFSDEPLPAAYKVPAAARLRASGGVAGKKVDRQAVEEYVREVDLPQAIAGVRDEARKIGGMRGQYLLGLSLCLETMWDLAMEVLGKGKPVPYLRCVEASTGRPPEASHSEAKRERVAELLGRAGYATSGSAGLLGAVDAWRRDRLVPMASVRALGKKGVRYLFSGARDCASCFSVRMMRRLLTPISPHCTVCAISCHADILNASLLTGKRYLTFFSQDDVCTTGPTRTDFHYDLTGLYKIERPSEGLSKDLFQTCIARVAKRKPDDARGRTELFKQSDKVTVFGDQGSERLSCREENLPISGVAQPQVTHCDR